MKMNASNFGRHIVLDFVGYAPQTFKIAVAAGIEAGDRRTQESGSEET
jgi:hypothetical protein